jgi:hypothetical protein
MGQAEVIQYLVALQPLLVEAEAVVIKTPQVQEQEKVVVLEGVVL